MKKVILWDGKNKSERPSTHQEYRLLNAILILGLVESHFVNHDDCQLAINQAGECKFNLTVEDSKGKGKILIYNATDEKDAFDQAWKLVSTTEWNMSDRVAKYNKFMKSTEIKCCGMYYTDETFCDNCGGNPQNLINRS